MRMNKHAKILDLVVLVVVVLFVWMNPFDIHLIKVVSAFRPKKPPANLPEDSRMGRRRRALLSDTRPLRLIAGSPRFI